MLRKYLICSAFVVAMCERKGRLFSFNFEDRDINIDLDFSIPFLSIPIKKTADSFDASELPMVNINPASLALGGAVVLGTTILLPLMMKNYASHSGYSKYARLLENTDFSADTLISFASQMLVDGRGLRECALRVACWISQGHYANPTQIVSHIASNKLLSSIVNSTAIEDAMISGRNGRDCASYSPCPIHKHHIPVIMDNLAIFTKYNI